MPLQGRILITGGAGFLARAIYRRAEVEGWDAEFTALSRDDAKHAALQHRFPNVKTIRADVAGDYPLLVAAMRGHDIVIHAAAAKYVDRSEHAAFDTVRTNITGSAQVIHAAIEARVRQLIGISTDKACEPVNVYGMTKAVMERLLHEAAAHSGLTDVFCVRYGNVVGSTGSVIPLFAQQLAETGKIKLTDPAMTRFWMSVEEAIELIVWTLREGVSGAMYVPEPGAMRMNALAYTVLGYEGLPDDLEGAILDERIEVIGKRPGEKMHEQLIHEQESPRARVGGPGPIEVHPPGGKTFGERTFTMRSDKPSHWLGPDDLRLMMSLAEGV